MPVGSPCSSRSIVAPARAGRRRRDPRDGEGEGVRHDGVTAAVVQEDRDIGGRCVQLVPRWIAAVGPGRGVVDGLHPAVGIRPGSRRRRTDRVQCGAPVGGRREVEPAEADPLAEWVSVRILEARQDGAALQIHEAGRRSRHGKDVALPAHGGDAVAGQREGLRAPNRDGSAGVSSAEREDGAAMEDEIRMVVHVLPAPCICAREAPDAADAPDAAEAPDAAVPRRATATLPRMIAAPAQHRSWP